MSKPDTFRPKVVSTKQPRGPGTKSVLPRYVAIGNYKGKRTCVDVGDYIPKFGCGRLILDFSTDGQWVGVEIIQ